MKLISYVSGTSTLDQAELNPNAKALAVALGTKREHGYIQGDASQNYFYSKLSSGDAAILEHVTGTNTIIDALAKATPDVTGFAIAVASDRTDGSLTGEISKSYLQNLENFDKTQSAYIREQGQPSNKSGILVSQSFLNDAIGLLHEEKTSGTYSTKA